MKKAILIVLAGLTCFARSIVAEPTETIWSIENVETYTVSADQYVRATGFYRNGYTDKAQVINVGSFALDGVFESYSEFYNLKQFDAAILSGAGELRVEKGTLYISPKTNMTSFAGTINAVNANQILFAAENNNPANVSFNISDGSNVEFTNGAYTLNGPISGAGILNASKHGNVTLRDDVIVKDASAGHVTVRGDISQFSGQYKAYLGSSIRLATTLSDSVNFAGGQGGSLLLSGAGEPKKTISVSSNVNVNTLGNVFMYGNDVVILNNATDSQSGTIFMGGKNEYTASEKVAYTLDSSTVKSADGKGGSFVAGGHGNGSVMADGSDIVVDGVTMSTVNGGGMEGARVEGDTNVTMKSGTVDLLIGGGAGAAHTGDSTVTMKDGSVRTLVGGDYFGGNVQGNVTVNMEGGSVKTIIGGANYICTSSVAEAFNGVQGNVQINVVGGTVDQIRGGVNSTNAGDAATARSKMVLNGNVEINVGGDAVITASDGEAILATGGSYGSVNGNTTINISDNAVINGIIAGGSSRGDNAGVKSTFVNVSGGTLSGDIYAGGLKYSTVTENTNVNITGGVINADIYGGGGKSTTVAGNANITISGDAEINGTIYGGGADATATVSGTKTLNIGKESSSWSGTVKVADFDEINVKGGSDAKIESIHQNLTGNLQGSRTVVEKGSRLEVTGDVENVITDGTNASSFVAGVTGGDAVVGGTVRTVINGENTSLNLVYGGNGGNQQENAEGKLVPIGTSNVGAVDVTVNAGTVSGFVLGSGAMYSDVRGDVNVTVNGGNVAAIYGAASDANVGGNVNIAVTGGVIAEDIAAGGAKNSRTAVGANKISGSTNVTLSGNAQVVGNVYGGGWGGADTIEGGTNVTLKDTASVGGTIYGGGIGGESVIAGAKTLNLGASDASWSGTVKVADFDKINVKGGSDATVEASMNGIVYEKQGKRYGESINGGLVSVEGSSVNMSGSTFNNNTVAGESIEMGGSFIVNGGIVKSDAVSSLNLNNVGFDQNNVHVKVDDHTNNYSAVIKGGMVFVGGTASFNGTSFTRNNVFAECYANQAGSDMNGGLIYVVENASANLNGVNVLGNTMKTKSDSAYASMRGAFLNAENGTHVDIRNTNVNGNTVSSNESYGPLYGGLIRSAGDMTANALVMNGNDISTNEGVASSIFGALLMVQGGTASVSNSTFAQNTMHATGTHPMFYGMVYVGGGDAATASTQALNISNSVFSENHAVSDYGINGVALNLSGTGASATVSNTVFENNTALAKEYKARGGAVHVYSGASLTLNDVSFKGNVAESLVSAAGSDLGQGGALYTRGAKTELNNVSFTNNTVKNGFGGAVYAEGASVDFNVTKSVEIAGNKASDAEGVVADSRGGFLYMKGAATANFSVAEDVEMTIGTNLGADSIASSNATATINKFGAGKLLVNSSMEYFSGALNVNGGLMQVNNKLGASAIAVASGATLSLQIRENNMLTANALTVANAGVISLVASSDLPTSTYSVAASGTVLEGNVVAYGGTYANNVFTAGALKEMMTQDFQPTSVSANDRMTITDNDSDVAIHLAFNMENSGLITIENAQLSSQESVEALSSKLASNEQIAAAWSLDADTSQSQGSRIMLSYLVGEGHQLSDFTAWHNHNDAGWEAYEGTNDRWYDGEYFGFSVDQFSEYAVSFVPEPSECASLLGLLVLAFIVRRRK